MDQQPVHPAPAIEVRGLPLGLMAVMFCVQIGIGIVLFAVFQEYVPRQPGASDAWGGFLLTAYGATRFFLETPVGAVLDRIERRQGLLIGLALMTPSIVLMYLVREPVAYLFFASALGLATAFLWPASYAISADLYPAARRGRVIGALNVAQFLGFGLGSLVGAVLIEDFAGVVLGVAAVSILVAFGLGVVSVPSYQHVNHLVSGQRPSIRDVISGPLLAVSVIILLVTTGVGIMLPAIRPYGEQVLDTSFRTVTLALTPAIVISALTYIPAGQIADRAGRMGPIIAGQCLSAGAIFAIAATDSLPLAAALAVPGFAGYALSVPAWNAAIMDLAPLSHRGTVIGFAVALTGFGLGLGPLIGGLVVEGFSPPAAFVVSGCTFAVAAVAAALYRLRITHVLADVETA